MKPAAAGVFLLLALAPAARAAPGISFMPNPVDCGAFPVNVVSVPITVTVTSSGTDILKITSFALGGANMADFMVPDPIKTPLTLNPKSNITFHVLMRASMVGMEAAEIDLQTNDPQNQDAVIPIQGTGASESITVMPAALDFGAVMTGTTSGSMPITITSTGDAAAMIDGITISGQGASEFIVDAPGAQSVAPKKSATVNVKFTPHAVGMYTATLTIAGKALSAPSTVMLTGSGLGATLTISPVVLDFGNVPVGATSSPQTVNIKNGMQSAISFASITSDNPLFAVDANATAPVLQPGATTAFNVSFSPVALGAQKGNVAVLLKGDTKPLAQIAVSGVGGGARPDMAMAASSPGRSRPGCSAAPSSGSARWLPLCALLLLALGLRRRA